jgi:hypothetical protein
MANVSAVQTEKQTQAITLDALRWNEAKEELRVVFFDFGRTKKLG